MPVTVTRIVGESYDLETGLAINAGIVLSNGVNETVVEVNEAVIKSVLSLWAESKNVEIPEEVKEPEVGFATHPVGPGPSPAPETTLTVSGDDSEYEDYSDYTDDLGTDSI